VAPVAHEGPFHHVGRSLMEPSYVVVVARYVRRQTRQLAAQLKGIRRGEDDECLHRARVATRRLRAALRMGGKVFGEKRVKRWRRAARQLARTLAEARDKDVQLALLNKLLHAPDAQSHGPVLALLYADIHAQRCGMQPAVRAAAGRFLRGGALREMRGATKRLLADPEAAEPIRPTPAACREAESRIVARLEQLLAFHDCLDDPDDCHRHHAMRIAAKRLRYTLEVANPLFGGRLEEIIAAVKQMQTLLGEIHDCDVWLAYLDAFTKAQRKRFRKYYGAERPLARLAPGIEYFRAERRAWRQRCFAELVAHWRQLEQRRAWGELLSTLRAASGEQPSTDTADAGRGEEQGGASAGNGKRAETAPPFRPAASARESAQAPARESPRRATTIGPPTPR